MTFTIESAKQVLDDYYDLVHPQYEYPIYKCPRIFNSRNKQSRIYGGTGWLVLWTKTV